ELVAPCEWREQQVLAIDRALQRAVFGGVHLVERRANDRDRPAAVVDRPGMRGEVDPFREPGDHDDPRPRAVSRELCCTTATLLRGLPRADDRDARTLE